MEPSYLERLMELTGEPTVDGMLDAVFDGFSYYGNIVDHLHIQYARLKRERILNIESGFDAFNEVAAPWKRLRISICPWRPETQQGEGLRFKSFEDFVEFRLGIILNSKANKGLLERHGLDYVLRTKKSQQAVLSPSGKYNSRMKFPYFSHPPEFHNTPGLFRVSSAPEPLGEDPDSLMHDPEWLAKLYSGDLDFE